MTLFRGTKLSESHFPVKGERVLEDALGVKVAILIIAGTPKTHIAKELNMSTARVSRLMETQEFKDTIRKLEQEALSSAKARLRVGVAGLADEVLKVIKQHLKEGNLQAIAPALKILGVTEEQAETQDTHITVMLPGAEQPKTIVVSPKDSK